MTMTSVAKFSAIYMLVAVLSGTAAAFWPAGPSDAPVAEANSAPRFILH